MNKNLIGNENNILFYEDELDDNSTCAKIAHMGNNGNKLIILNIII